VVVGMSSGDILSAHPEPVEGLGVPQRRPGALLSY
jgi:hypothetical protein